MIAHKISLTLSGVLLVAVAAGACGILPGGEGEGAIRVGAVSFAENQIVAELYALVLEEAGFSVERRFNFQDRESLQPRMEAGDIDLAPEYLASLLTFLRPNATPSSDPAENIERLKPLLQRLGLDLLRPSEANDTNALVVQVRTANKLDLKDVSDLADHDHDLVFGGPPECPDRRFCLKGLRDVYGLEFEDFKRLDAGGPLTIAALESREIDVALLFSTSGIIQERSWVVLDDDKRLQAAENITPVIRSKIATEEIAALLNGVSERLTTSVMTTLNGLVEIANRDFRAVAREFLEDAGLL
ncbi:MAG: glycine betaine ABC transporter substrate-binding protein [Actinomycetota bacterium]